jgi:hypothetical protein
MHFLNDQSVEIKFNYKYSVSFTKLTKYYVYNLHISILIVRYLYNLYEILSKSIIRYT